MISPYQVVYAGVRPNVERLVIIVRGVFQILRCRQDTPTSLNSFPLGCLHTNPFHPGRADHHLSFSVNVEEFDTAVLGQ